MNIPKASDSFFRKQKQELNIAGPVAIISTLSFFLIFRSIMIQLTVSQTMTPFRTSQYFFNPVTIFMYFYYLLLPFILWGCYSLAFYVLSIPFGGTGGFRQTFILIGWGFFPRIITEVLYTIFFIYVGLQMPNPDIRLNSYEYLVELIYNPVLTIPIAVGIFLTVYTIPDLIWTYAVKHSREISTKNAFIVVSGPVAVSLLLRINKIIDYLNI